VPITGRNDFPSKYQEIMKIIIWAGIATAQSLGSAWFRIGRLSLDLTS
jgi:hypothetical protein